MTTNDHYPTDFEMLDDMSDFSAENAAKWAAEARAAAALIQAAAQRQAEGETE